MLGHLAWQLIALQVLDLGLTWHALTTGVAQELNPNGQAYLAAGFFTGPVLAKASGTGLALAAAGWTHRASSPKAALVGLWVFWSLMVAVVVWNAFILLGSLIPAT
jgi:hypothetical protein